MPGAVIAYAKAGERYETDYGCGAYVHIGALHFNDGNGNPMSNSDFGRGFIGTAAALWVEANGFEGFGAYWNMTTNGVWNATVSVYPSLLAIDASHPDFYYIRLGLAIHGLYQFPQAYYGAARFEDLSFGMWIDAANWSDVRMKACVNNPPLSRKGYAPGSELSGLWSADSGTLPEVATGSALYLASFIPQLAPAAAVIEGVLLLAEWMKLAASSSIRGVDNYDQLIQFHYFPNVGSETIADGSVYQETASIIVVDLRVPIGTRGGWKTLPLTCSIDVQVADGRVGPGNYHWIENDHVIETAITFERLKGQKDAGIDGDAGNTYSSARPISFPGGYYGYIDGSDDTADCYSFYVGYATGVAVVMTPPAYVNFDLEVVVGSTTYKSQNGPGMTDAIIVVISSPMTIKAKVYKVSGSGVYSFSVSCSGGGGCPTLFVWNGTAYTEESILNIHAETDITLQQEIEQQLHPQHGFYNLQLRELDNFTSHIDQVKLYAVDKGGEWHLCPLLLAEYKDTYITLKLLLDDAKRVDLKPTETITMKFLPTIPCSQTDRFIFEINGHNTKIP